MDGRWGGQDVSGVAEGWEVAYRCHVSSQGSSAKGGGLLLHTLGQLLKALCPLFILLGFVRHLPVPSLDPFLLHGQWPVHLGGKTKPSGGQVPFPEQDLPPCILDYSRGRSRLGPHLQMPTIILSPALQWFQEGRISLCGANLHPRALSPLSAGIAPDQHHRNPLPHFCFKQKYLLGPAVGDTSSQLALFYGSPSGAQGFPKPSQAKRESVAGASCLAAQRAAVPGEGWGRWNRADSHCAACSKGHRRCRQGLHWRFGAIRWWWLSDNLHNRCLLSWQQT